MCLNCSLTSGIILAFLGDVIYHKESFYSQVHRGHLLQGNTVERTREASILHKGLGRVEAFDFAREGLGQLKDLIASSFKGGIKGFSFHAPVPRPEYFPFPGVTSFLLNEDPANRQLSLHLLEDTLKQAREWGAEYVVCHLTYRPTDTQDEKTAMRLAEQACRRLAEMSSSYGVPIHIEFAPYSVAFHRPGQFLETVGVHGELGICIDVGHAFLGTRQQDRNYLKDIETLAPYARSMHLWNARDYEHYKKHGHIPLHPSQRPQEGWLDVECVLEAVLSVNPEVKIIFEYPVKEVTREVQEGFDWVEGIVKRFNGSRA
jgi:sugar phosphate isomerase/epimerase